MRRLLTKNLGWKLLSLGLAVVGWYMFVGNRALMTTVSVGVQYKNPPDGIEISTDSPERVTLELLGPSARLSNFDQIRAPVILDLSDVKGPGERTYTIEAQNVALPSGVELVRAIPPQMRLRFDRYVSREIPVRVFTTGSLPEGYRIVTQVVTPQVVQVRGTQKRVDALMAAETDTIDISGLVETKEFLVNVFVDEAHVQLESSPQVKVKIVVERATTELHTP